MKLVLIFLFFLSANDFKERSLFFKGTKLLTVEVADNNTLRAQGFMHRTKLEENKGMLFVFDNPQKLSFWNKNTFIPLSIGYFDKNKILKEIYDMSAQNIMERQQNIKSYSSECICLYALEVNQGWFKRNKIKVGTPFSFIQDKQVKDATK